MVQLTHAKRSTDVRSTSLPGDSLIESFRFWDEDDYEYEISSKQNSGLTWANVVSAEKRDNHCHSTRSFSENVIVAGTSNQNFRSLIIMQPGKG